MAEKTKEEAAEKAEQPKIADVKAVKMVAIRALRPFRVKGSAVIVQPGAVVQVTPEEAERLTRESNGPYSFRGERYHNDGDAHRAKLTKTVRIEATA